eukprot:XP_028348334.1 uncharacterized protein LOC114486646 isoform X2 [Physeter catodon]
MKSLTRPNPDENGSAPFHLQHLFSSLKVVIGQAKVTETAGLLCQKAGHLLESPPGLSKLPAAQAGPQSSYSRVAGPRRACSLILDPPAEQPGRRTLLLSVARGFPQHVRILLALFPPRTGFPSILARNCLLSLNREVGSTGLDRRRPGPLCGLSKRTDLSCRGFKIHSSDGRGQRPHRAARGDFTRNTIESQQRCR